MIIAEGLVELEERYLTRKTNIESKGLKVNIGMTKIMKWGTNEGPVFTSGRYPSNVCKRQKLNVLKCLETLGTQKMQRI